MDSCSKSELSALTLKEDFIEKVSQRLDLSYDSNEDEGVNVCYMTAPEIQPLYRLVFNKSDIVDYISLTLNAERFSIERDTVPFPMELFAGHER